MPPTYFHGNYKWYKEHNNTYLTEQIISYITLFFNTVTTTINFCQWRTRVFMLCLWKFAREKVTTVTIASAKMHHPLPHCAHIHCLVSVNTQQMSMTVNGCHCSCIVSSPHLHFIHPFTSDAILSDCPSAAICHTTTTCSGILVGKFILCCHTTNIHFWCHEPT